jgi:hypothetical protein
VRLAIRKLQYSLYDLAGSADFMRRFTSPDGASWDAVIGHESWGTFVVLFTPVEGGSVRKAVLSSETAMGAEVELDALGDDKLRELLVNSNPW